MDFCFYPCKIGTIFSASGHDIDRVVFVALFFNVCWAGFHAIQRWLPGGRSADIVRISGRVTKMTVFL